MNERYWKWNGTKSMSGTEDLSYIREIQPAHVAAGEWQTDLSLAPDAQIIIELFNEDLDVTWYDLIWGNTLNGYAEYEQIVAWAHINQFNPPEVSNG